MAARPKGSFCGASRRLPGGWRRPRRERRRRRLTAPAGLGRDSDGSGSSSTRSRQVPERMGRWGCGSGLHAQPSNPPIRRPHEDATVTVTVKWSIVSANDGQAVFAMNLRRAARSPSNWRRISLGGPLDVVAACPDRTGSSSRQPQSTRSEISTRNRDRRRCRCMANHRRKQPAVLGRPELEF
jgi:hypothetical protein